MEIFFYYSKLSAFYLITLSAKKTKHALSLVQNTLKSALNSVHFGAYFCIFAPENDY